MKKFTLCLSLLMAGAAAASAVAPNAMPEVSTSRDDAKLYAISSYRGMNKGAAILNGTETEVAANTVNNEVPETAMWYLLAGAEEGTYYICNYGLYDADWADEQPALGKSYKVELNTTEACVWYLLPNGVNENGLTISSENPFAGTSCLDKASSGAGLSGGWIPAANDWEGTTWSFVPVDKNATSEANWETVNEAWITLHAGPIKSNGLAAAAALKTASPWTAPLYDGVADQINALENPTEAAINEILNSVVAEATDLVKKNIVGATFAMQGSRAANEKKKNTYVCAEEMATDSIGVTLMAEPLGRAYWTAVEAEGGFLLKNFANNLYLKMPVAKNARLSVTEDATEASVFNASFRMTNNAGVVFSSVVTPAEGETPAVEWAMVIDGSAVMVVTYNVTDGGAAFNLTVTDPAGVEKVMINNENAPVEYFNIQGVRVNPETAGPGLYIRRQGNQAVKVLVR
ncbi:MAG: hypothetical protein NC342_01265 [Pseudoflavonifractor sp.]|nr:hypothetical protein [Alloprevotella sp.]MCM1116153.1 hypothetical protein [Pseudoflavonifractor sp.]